MFSGLRDRQGSAGLRWGGIAYSLEVFLDFFRLCIFGDSIDEKSPLDLGKREAGLSSCGWAPGEPEDTGRGQGVGAGLRSQRSVCNRSLKKKGHEIALL